MVNTVVNPTIGSLEIGGILMVPKSLCCVVLPLCLVGVPPALGVLTLDPGTLIGGDVDTGTIVKYDQSGNILDTLPFVDGVGIGTFDGLTVFRNALFVCGTTNTIGQVDLTTGVVFGAINGVTVSGTETLGNSPTELLLGGFSSNTIDRFDAGGVYQGTITLNTNVGMTGVDSDGTSLIVGSYNDGNIYIYDMAGNQTGVVNTGIGSGVVSGLGYDESNGTVWLSLGFGNDSIVQFDLAGNHLTTFASNRGWINGLDIVPIPAPGAGAVAALGALALARRRR
jgi:hypothetical protein